MKLLLAIVSNDDANSVIRALYKEKFQATKLATTGGFLTKGNSTLIVGVDDKEIDKAIDIIGKESKKRTEIVPSGTMFGTSEIISSPVEVTVGGATIFVLDVDKFVKL